MVKTVLRYNMEHHMTNPFRPNLPVPPPLRGAQYGSFAYQTIVERVPRIGRRVLEENEFAPAVRQRLEQLLDEIPYARIRILRDTIAPDTPQWIEYVSPYLNQNWLQVPWFFAENYFYRRILEATEYFSNGAGAGDDPFGPHKEQSLQASWPRIVELAQRLQGWQANGWQDVTAAEIFSLALWGNQGDLSMWPEGADEIPDHESGDAAAEHVLVDDSEEVTRYLQQQEPGRVDFLMDNAAFELIGDLALMDYLLDSGQATSAVLHLKAHPVFVSDVLPAGVRQTIQRLVEDEDEALSQWGARLQGYLHEGRVQMTRHFFWTSPLAGWEMPRELRDVLSGAQLVISKGDAHYRRLLGDRHWSYTAPFDQIVSYFPAPLLALRTLKSEVACGLQPKQVAELNGSHPGWTTSGDWGVMQFARGRRT
jgi:uncharacterized protein with ATP-grasp and redox domains